MADRTTSVLTIESTLGLCASRGSRTIDVGAGAGEGLLVVADGMGGIARAGAMQSRRAAELVYEACAADFGDPAALPRDLATVFSEIDRGVANVPKHARIHGLLVGCIAATLEGARVRGTHAGIGRALLLRASAHHFESLVVEHYLHLVAYSDATRAAVPTRPGQPFQRDPGSRSGDPGSRSRTRAAVPGPGQPFRRHPGAAGHDRRSRSGEG